MEIWQLHSCRTVKRQPPAPVDTVERRLLILALSCDLLSFRSIIVVAKYTRPSVLSHHIQCRRRVRLQRPRFGCYIQDIHTEIVARDSLVIGRLTMTGYAFPCLLTVEDFKKPAWKFFHEPHMNGASWRLGEGLKLPKDILRLVLAEGRWLRCSSASVYSL
jgi:hypothetical protein